MKYEIKKVKEGEEQGFLEGGWEPFSTVAEDASYEYFDTRGQKERTHHQSIVYIYLRRVKEVQNG
jgi:hypothetical protein